MEKNDRNGKKSTVHTCEVVVGGGRAGWGWVGLWRALVSNNKKKKEKENTPR